LSEIVSINGNLNFLQVCHTENIIMILQILRIIAGVLGYFVSLMCFPFITGVPFSFRKPLFVVINLLAAEGETKPL
jgi:hypothetical protein